MAKTTLSGWEGRFSSIYFWWAVGFGSGLIKPAPGTWGSLFGLLIGLGVLSLPYGFYILAGLSLLVTIISVWVINEIEKKAGVHDAPEIVIDEFVGQWIALLPIALNSFSLAQLLTAFILFRIFDILKPWPIGWLDRRVSGGFGVMVDDIMAGIVSAIGLTVLIYSGIL